MEKTLQEAIGYYRGWNEAAPLPVKVAEAVEVIITHSLLQVASEKLLLPAPVIVDEVDLEAIERRVADRYLTIGEKDCENLDLSLPLKTLAEVIKEATPADEAPLLRIKTLEAFKSKRKSRGLLPADHNKKPYCYQCKNLLVPRKGYEYPWCKVHKVPVRAWASERICKEHVHCKPRTFLLPHFTCSRCRHLKKSMCPMLAINIDHPTEDKYGMCPYWKSKFNEPCKAPKPQTTGINNV